MIFADNPLNVEPGSLQLNSNKHNQSRRELWRVYDFVPTDSSLRRVMLALLTPPGPCTVSMD